MLHAAHGVRYPCVSFSPGFVLISAHPMRFGTFSLCGAGKHVTSVPAHIYACHNFNSPREERSIYSLPFDVSKRPSATSPRWHHSKNLPTILQSATTRVVSSSRTATREFWLDVRHFADLFEGAFEALTSFITKRIILSEAVAPARPYVLFTPHLACLKLMNV